MYSILFHISGIALLEIGFYFYYIGPMETVIFTNKVERLADEPINNPYAIPSLNYTTGGINVEPDSNYNYVDLYSLPSELSIRTVIQNSVIFNDTTFYDDIKNDRDAAIDRREKKNHILFIATMEYWIGIAFINILIYVIIHRYRSIKALEKTNGITMVSTRNRDEESLELVETSSYRRHSIDDNDEHLETNTTSIQKQILTKGCKKLAHYLFFAICLISFQYTFFKNVILVYDPLSIEEVKYIVYNLVLPKLLEERNKIVSNI